MKWSDSIDKLFRTCQRKYYISVLVAHPTARDSLRRKAFRLSQLSDLNRWKGHLVHTAIKEYVVPELAAGHIPDFKVVKQQTLALAREQELFSQEESYERIPKSQAGLRYCSLRVHYDGEKLDTESREQVWTDVSASIDKLATQQDLLKEILRAEQHSSEKSLRFYIRDIFVDAQPDLVFRSEGNELVIIDWKRYQSVPGNAHQQLALYAYAAVKSGRWDDLTDAEQIHLYEVNLHNEQEEVFYQYQLTMEDLNAVEDRIFLSALNIQSIVKGRNYKEVNITDFDPARSSLTCDYCVFYNLCREMSNGKLRTGGQQLPLFIS
jgi:hypothetical protein